MLNPFQHLTASLYLPSLSSVRSRNKFKMTLGGYLLFLLSFWRSQFNTLYYRNRRYGNKHYDKVCRYEITENDRLRWVVYAMLPNNFSPNYRKIQCQITEY